MVSSQQSLEIAVQYLKLFFAEECSLKVYFQFEANL